MMKLQVVHQVAQSEQHRARAEQELQRCAVQLLFAQTTGTSSREAAGETHSLYRSHWRSGVRVLVLNRILRIRIDNYTGTNGGAYTT
jgi:hypothetical protein